MPGETNFLRRVARWMVWILAIILVYLSFRGISLTSLATVIGRLDGFEILVLLFANAAILFILSGRWWTILNAQGIRIPYLKLSAYRLAAFAISYFTPGPQFGGEPFQIVVVREKHNVPAATIAASIALDKAIELLGNFFFLTIGILIVLNAGFLPEGGRLPILTLSLFLVLMPAIYLFSIWRNLRPLGWISKRIAVRNTRLINFLTKTELLTIQFIRHSPKSLVIAMLFSIITWVALMGEYVLALRFLDLPLNLEQVLSVMIAARFAFLTPLPGGLGVLAAGQILTFQALGYSAADGASLALLIRGRDLLFGGLGLYLVSFYASDEVRKRIRK